MALGEVLNDVGNRVVSIIHISLSRPIHYTIYPYSEV